MKTISTLLILASLLAALRAQTPTNAPTNAPAPADDRAAALRRLLDQSYAKIAATSAPAVHGTNTLAAAPLAAGTNLPKPITTMVAPDVAPATPKAATASPTAATPAAAAPVTAAPSEAKPVPAGGLATPSAAPNVAGAPAPAPAPGAGAMPAFPARNPLTLSNVAAALRARGLTNQAMALTNTALTTTNAIMLPGTRTGAVTTATTPTAPRPAPAGTRPATNVVVPPAAGGAAVPPNVAGAVAPPAGGIPGAAARGVPTNAPADDIIPPGVIKFQEADLTPVLDIYQDLTGRTILRPSSLPATKITIKTQSELTRKEAILALDSILSMNGITMVPQGDKFVKAVPQAQANQEANQFYTGTADQLPEAGTLVTYIVQLSNAPPQDVAQVLQQFAKMPGNSILAIPATGVLVLRDYAENVKRMLDIVAKIDVIVPKEYDSVVIPIKYALASDIANVVSSLSASGGATTVGQQQTRTGLSTGGGGFGQPGLGGAGGMGGMGGLGQQGYNPANPMGGGMGSRTGGLGSGTAGRSSFSDRLKNIVQRATSAASGEILVLTNTKIIADERTNSLLIFATKEDIATIKDIISKLDVVLAQVLIEALIFEVSLDETLDYGFSYLQRSPSTVGSFSGIGALIPGNQPVPSQVPYVNAASGGSSSSSGSGSTTGTGNNTALPSGFSYFARWGDFDMAMKAIATDARVNVLQRPRIQTSHAVEANLFVGQTRPYPTGSSYGGYYGGYSSIQQLQIGITLSVLPLINVDGLVVMDIRQKIQSVGGTVTIANVGEVPETIDREANAKVAVRDHETVVLGGFISNEKRSSGSGVPILKDIPLLGVLFRSTSKSSNRRELMIMIRPTVLPSPQDASMAAMEEKSRMPGVMRMDRESKEAERKVQEKTYQETLKREGLPY